MPAASAAASLCSSLPLAGARMLPPWQLPLRSPPPHVAFSLNVGGSGGLRSPHWGGLTSGGWGRHPVVTVAGGGNYNLQVVAREDESDEHLVNRFRAAVLRAGIIQECKRRRFHETRQAERKRRARESAKRNRKRRPRFRDFSPVDEGQVGSQVGSEEDEEEDNWELPVGDLPY